MIIGWYFVFTYQIVCKLFIKMTKKNPKKHCKWKVKNGIHWNSKVSWFPLFKQTLKMLFVHSVWWKYLTNCWAIFSFNEDNANVFAHKINENFADFAHDKAKPSLPTRIAICTHIFIYVEN